MIDNLNKEFLVYKSDLLETIDKNNEKLYSKIDNVRNEMRILETKLENKMDKLTYTVLFAMLVPIIVQIATKYIH